MKSRCAVLLAVSAVSIALTACGGGSDTAEAPSRASVINCIHHSGTGGRVYEREVPAEIGALPAHDEIETVGYSEGNLEFAIITIDLFKEGSEGEEAAEQLAKEQSKADVNQYVGGTVVSIIAEGTPSPKDKKLIEECVGSAPEGS